MAFDLKEINFRTVADPKGFIEECDDVYASRVKDAAEELERRGVHAYYVGMDDYFKSVDPATAPRTPEGDIDLESPLCLDMELLNEHFTMLAAGERIYIPKYEFSRQMNRQSP